MKKLLITLLLAVLSTSAMAKPFDKEEYCRTKIDIDTSRAKLGIQMRTEMSNKCKGSIVVCAESYEKRIDDQEEKDKLELIKIFNRESPPADVRFLMLATVASMKTAALMGFYEGKTTNQIALELYSRCLNVP